MLLFVVVARRGVVEIAGETSAAERMTAGNGDRIKKKPLAYGADECVFYVFFLMLIVTSVRFQRQATTFFGSSFRAQSDETLFDRSRGFMSGLYHEKTILTRKVV